MTITVNADGAEHELTLTEECRAASARHPGWHVWTSSTGHPYATRTSRDGGMTLYAPHIAMVDHVIALWEYEQRRAGVSS